MSENTKIDLDFSACKSGDFYLKIAESEHEINQAKILRNFIFFEEPKGERKPSGKLDEDEFDKYCDHFLVMHSNNDNDFVVGTYRILRRDNDTKVDKFYTETEYDISKIIDSKSNLMELGRSCIHPDYRDGKVIQLLWKGIGKYVSHYKIDYMFGCASFPSLDIKKHENSILFLHQNYLSPEEIRPQALTTVKADIDLTKKIDIDKKEAFSEMPALLKGYIRSGCMIGYGAVVDKFCKTIDVCIIMDTKKISKRYSNHFVK